MERNKIGVVFLMSALVLAGVGISYAGWTDTITISGEVSTGSVDWDVTEYSGTFVYKIDQHGKEVVPHSYAPEENKEPTTPAGAIAGYEDDEGNTHPWVAAAWAEQGDDEDSVKVYYENLFPCIDFEADIVITYTGSIPGRISKITSNDEWPDTADETAMDQDAELIIEYKKADANNWVDLPVDELAGFQLHQGDQIHVILRIHLPQNNDLMGLTGSFEYEIEVVQWDEFGYYQNFYESLDQLSLSVLDGIADDSFDVYVDNILVYSYTNGEPINDPEIFHTHDIDLTPYAIPSTGTHTVKIDATGVKWASFDTYGQLAVDEITLSIDSDSQTVDIGDTNSESGHNLKSWGPIEPEDSGGNYGGIDNCRVTWDYNTDSTHATIDFTFV